MMRRSAYFFGQSRQGTLIASSFFKQYSVIATTILTFPKVLDISICPLVKFFAIPDKKS